MWRFACSPRVAVIEPAFSTTFLQEDPMALCCKAAILLSEHQDVSEQSVLLCIHICSVYRPLISFVFHPTR